jgi:hypothetical protein
MAMNLSPLYFREFVKEEEINYKKPDLLGFILWL